MLIIHNTKISFAITCFLISIISFFTIFAVPIKEIPEHLYNDYTLDGKIPVSYWFRDDSYSGDTPLIYSKEQIESFIHNAQQKMTRYYGATDTWLYFAIEKHITSIREKSVAILGSTIPWYESIILAYGGEPTTIEYNKIISEDPRLKVLTVTEFEQHPQQFDAVISISSFEHDGLGRYGDPLDPQGDFHAMQKAKAMLKKGGLLFLAVPISRDLLSWNVHRIYGAIRLPLLLAGWEVLDSFGFSPQDFQRNNDFAHQPLFVLKPQ